MSTPAGVKKLHHSAGRDNRPGVQVPPGAHLKSPVIAVFAGLFPVRDASYAQKSHNRLRTNRIEALRNGVEVVLEQVRVGVESHCCAGVAEHAFECLSVGVG